MNRPPKYTPAELKAMAQRALQARAAGIPERLLSSANTSEGDIAALRDVLRGLVEHLDSRQ